MSDFRFTLSQNVLVNSGRGPLVGVVVARSEYANGTPNLYFVRYIDVRGIEVEDWFEEGRLSQ